MEIKLWRWLWLRLRAKDDFGMFFNSDYYRGQFQNVPFDDDGRAHFCSQGWRDRYDPSVWFETRYYLEANPDIAAAGTNPLAHYVTHGRREGRAPVSKKRARTLIFGPPRVSVIIASGTQLDLLLSTLDVLEKIVYSEIEIIIIVEPYAAMSPSAIEEAVSRYTTQPRIVQSPPDATNLLRWRSGIEFATGDLIWLIDCSRANTSQTLHRNLMADISAFFDDSVMASVGSGPIAKIISAHLWFKNDNRIRASRIYTGDVIFRRQEFSASFGRDFKTTDQSAQSHAFADMEALLREVVNGGQIAVGASLPQSVVDLYRSAENSSASRASRQLPRKLHVLLGFDGFFAGGAEIFTVHLANALTTAGVTASIFAMADDDVSELRQLLNPKVAIYRRNSLHKRSVAHFIDDIGADVISSHCASFNALLFGREQDNCNVPIVATLHGHYDNPQEAIPEPTRIRLASGVTHWVYTAQKNLRFLETMAIDSNQTSFISNGTAIDERPFPKTREDFGIDKDALVFALVARPVPEKGWKEAILATLAARQRTKRPITLLLCGKGELADELHAEWGHDRGFVFLGFQDRINGLFRMSDCALLPSRFWGESFPLCLIQAMHSGTPIIATDVGSIEMMICEGTRAAGVLVDAQLDDTSFVAALTDAMVRMADDEFRTRRASDALELGRRFTIERCAKAYAALYHQLVKERSFMKGVPVFDVTTPLR